eukprot:CAMPEP_0174736718 /NCGR_PEP_ID=MMETSP1094-20130205/67158_1 /TAXON_ID=156173 /ORGANISM="Chrysochromulina brevifilum, Strain UTEX LB 985" /LENGTH=163 /DNA_ID=CAMNT_0015939865 /DNA_START=61 /DNA_END=552 /DNA_ORIENTATION=-
MAYLSHVPNDTFQVALLFCGYLPSTHLGIMARIESRRPLTTPAFVFMGELDYTITNEMTQEAVTVFASATVSSSAATGHSLPSATDQTFSDILSFLSLPPLPPPIVNNLPPSPPPTSTAEPSPPPISTEACVLSQAQVMSQTRCRCASTWLGMDVIGAVLYCG